STPSTDTIPVGLRLYRRGSVQTEETRSESASRSPRKLPSAGWPLTRFTTTSAQGTSKSNPFPSPQAAYNSSSSDQATGHKSPSLAVLTSARSSIQTVEKNRLSGG